MITYYIIYYLYFCTAPMFLFCSNRRIINVSMMMMMMMIPMSYTGHGSSLKFNEITEKLHGI